MSQLQTISGDHQAVRKTNRQAVLAWRKNIVGKTCDCGRPAIRFKNCEFICQRCDDIEQAARNHYVSQQLRLEKIMKPFDELCEVTKHRLTAKSYAEKMAEYDRGENRFAAVILEAPSEITICGHGVYHIRIEKEAA